MMSKRYVLREGLSTAMIPGAGKVTRGMYLTGDYGAYCPSLLVEILDSTPPPPPPARLLTEPKQESAAPPKRELLTETLPVEGEVLVEEEERPKRKSRKRKRLFSSEE